MALPEYHLIRSDRKTLAIQIMPDGALVVRAPRKMGLKTIEGFISKKREWIEKHQPKQAAAPVLTDAQIRHLAQQAKQFFPERTACYAKLLGVSYGRITIRNQRTRWGSCSNRGNLNFNCLLMLAPEHVADYVVVHELCHRKVMNHSARFWAEVERILPAYRESRRWLKENGQSLIGRMDPSSSA